MGRIATPLCLVLAILLAFAGGTIDLCSCDSGVHGVFCAQSETGTSCHESAVAPLPPPDSCCTTTAPAPVAVSESCCGGEDEAPASGPELELRGAGCGCPVLTLDHSPSESATSASPTTGLDRSSDVAHLASSAALGGWLAPASSARGGEPWPSWRPHRSKLRRHLELHVIRC